MGGNVTIQGKLNTDRRIVEEIYTTNNAAWLHLKSSEINPPQYDFLNWQIITTSSANQALPADLSIYGSGFVVITYNGGVETVALEALVDGTVASDAILVRTTAGTFVAATALVAGTYYFPVCFKSMRLRKSNAVQQVTATFAFKSLAGAA